MPPATSLRRKFALLLALLLALPSLVSGGILVHLYGMRRDANRLLEETRESGLAKVLQVHIETASSLLSFGDLETTAPSLRTLGRAQIAAARKLLREVEEAHPPRDPSRPSHQSTESDLVLSVAADLDAALRHLDAPEGLGFTDVLASLAGARHKAAILAQETLRESALANQDVGVRTRASRRFLYATVATMALVSLVALLLSYRVVLSPLRHLRRGAERLRGGDLDHRIAIRSTDELGDLGRAFNEMADEIGKSHAELEEKIASRTRELVRTARLADIGVLAAGVAHEINNPLASIASCGEGLLRRLEAGPVDPAAEKEYLETIVAEAYRTRGITAQLLDLARQDHGPFRELDVPALFQQASTLTTHLLARKRLHLEVDVAAELPPLAGDPGELLQLLLNLILNARDASPEGEEIRLCARAEARAQVWRIEDRGTGIDAADVERIFDPFFTTKAPHAGTGLGLSLSAAIVDRHGGTIKATRREGGGTRFEVRLPVDQEGNA